MLYAYKFRIYPNKDQRKIIEETFAGVCMVYNQFLKERIELYENEKKSISYFTQAKEVKGLRQNNPWLKEVDSTALYSAARNLDVAYQNFFRRVKKGEKPGFPKFKRQDSYNQSYRSYGRILVNEKTVCLPKLKEVICRVTRPVQGRILSAVVSRNSCNKYFVSLCCDDVEINSFPSTGKSIELKFGPELVDNVFCITSDGVEYDIGSSIENVMPRVIYLQQKLSKLKKGTRKYEETRILLAKVHEKVTNQRKDMLHKLSTSIVREYDHIIITELPLKEIQQNDHEAAKKIRDAAWGEFKRQLLYKAKWYGKEVIVLEGKT